MDELMKHWKWWPINSLEDSLSYSHCVSVWMVALQICKWQVNFCTRTSSLMIPVVTWTPTLWSELEPETPWLLDPIHYSLRHCHPEHLDTICLVVWISRQKLSAWGGWSLLWLRGRVHPGLPVPSKLLKSLIFKYWRNPTGISWG